MQKKITIIGAGSVGAATAYSILARGAASEVVLIDINTDKALGEALDIKQATPFLDNCDIIAGSYADAVGSDVVIITSGVGRKPGQTRLELVQINVNILKSIANEITKYAPNALQIPLTFLHTRSSSIQASRRARCSVQVQFLIQSDSVHASLRFTT